MKRQLAAGDGVSLVAGPVQHEEGAGGRRWVSPLAGPVHGAWRSPYIGRGYTPVSNKRVCIGRMGNED